MRRVLDGVTIQRFDGKRHTNRVRQWREDTQLVPLDMIYRTSFRPVILRDLMADRDN